ncbi:uncharacterized protein TOT_010001064 [Theileria orientalis strain Shintoku]|uniref:Uncharacterized protein n=1 Tax=Theileria orientalis strain Shintoku TaxID=869250 RepID=J4D6J4_THEOR|nr:uncharacterized protein TOT_010001064 [Theileria orientalis strain Shintoku]BAM39610.1 uncharacterized protein TOT_010001064 [Theileria orientalis strain Shintoku]|eukprot:XP_009689911.1 uncharacterized protein TOT_010001064 [Theileria orientalis strain Shintoku]
MDEFEGIPYTQCIGIDRLCNDYSSTLVPYLLRGKYLRRRKKVHHKDVPSELRNVMPVCFYAKLPNQYNGVCSHLVHSATNRNKFPNISLKWFPNGRMLLAGTQGGKFIMWNGITFQFDDIKRFPVGTGSVTCFEWSPFGDFLVAGDEYGKLALLSPALSLLNTNLYEGMNNSILDLSLSPNGSKFVACSDTYSPHIFDVQTSALEGMLVAENIGSTSITCLQWNPFKNLVVTGSRTNIITLWDAKNRGQITSIYAHKSPLHKILWNPNGVTFLTTALDGLVKLWDVRILKPLLMYRVTSTNQEDSIYMSNVNNINVLKTTKAVTIVTAMSWNPVQTNVFAVGDNKSRLFHFTTDFTDPVSTVNLQETEDKYTTTTSMDFHPFGHLLATCSDDKYVRFWSRSMPGGHNRLSTEDAHFLELDNIKYSPFTRFKFKSQIDLTKIPSMKNIEK